MVLWEGGLSPRLRSAPAILRGPSPGHALRCAPIASRISIGILRGLLRGFLGHSKNPLVPN